MRARAHAHSRPARAAAILAAVVGLSGAAAMAAPIYQAWLAHRAAALRTPGLARYYAFTGLTPDAPSATSLVGDPAPLTWSLTPLAGTPDEALTPVAGRFAEEGAYRIDRGVFSGPPVEVGADGFTAMAWLRANGMGSLHDPPVATGATLLSQGSGYYDGWRLTLHYPDASLGFEVGRRAGSVGIGGLSGSSVPMPDGLWHHVAATWDRHQMRIYLDGVLAALGAYDGDYTASAQARLVVGYADSGWGSAVLDVDAVAVYTRALTSAEVAREALWHEAEPAGLVARLNAADAATSAGDPKAAARDLEAVASAGAAPSGLKAVARLRLAALAQAGRDAQAAGREALAVAHDAGLPDGLRGVAAAMLARLAVQPGWAMPSAVGEMLLAAPGLGDRDRLVLRLNLARAYRREGKAAEARKAEQEALNMPEASGRDKLDVRLQLGHSLAAAGDYDGARGEYGAIAADAAAPAHFRSYAGLCIARTYVRQKRWADAAAEYAGVAKAADTPWSHRLEAEECGREVERMKAGKPARDPAWHRVKVAAAPAPGLKLYVAPTGADGNPGTKARPLATLEAARDAIRALKATRPLPRGGVQVILAPGEYPRANTFELSAEDSGAEGAPVVYRSEAPGQARISGGARVTGFRPVTDPTVLARLPEEARGKVVQADLRGQGISDLGAMQARGYGHGPTPELQVFFDGKPMRLARWPNKGFLQTGAGTAGNPGPTFTFEGDRPARWAAARDLFIFGYPMWLWADERLPVASLDAQAHTATLATGSATGLNPGAPFHFLNLLEEIDEPGEWYLDRQAGILYLYPPSDPAKAEVRVSAMAEPMVKAEGVSWLRLEGLSIELGRADGVDIAGGDHCLVAGCIIGCLGGTGVTIAGGSAHGVFGCDIGPTGRNGTWVSGGDRKTLTPGGHFIENCHIHDFSCLDRTYTPAVYMEGCGNRVAHNVFHDSPGHGIRLEGNDHVIELNEIHRVCMETDDQGGLDIFWNPTYRGNIFRWNYWHDIGDPDYVTPCGRAGIRLDDAICGVLIYGNVFRRCSQANFGGVQVHGGKENVIENNVFADCGYGISFSPWGADLWRQRMTGPEIVRKTTEEVDISHPPYSTRYPELAHLLDNPDINMVWRNLVYNCGSFLTRDGGREDVMDNCIADRDPGFADAQGGDFGLKPGAAAFDALCFRPIPFGDIGLYDHPLRASRPAARAKGGKP